jgi:hypothetical protein
MRKLRVIRIFAAMLIAAGSFTAEYWFYGGSRGMIETFGFHPAMSAFTFALTAFVVALLLLPWLLIKFFWFADRGLNPRLVAMLLAGGIVLGGVAAEIRIMTDEALFLAEIGRTRGTELLVRDRAWPNELCTLIYRPGQAPYATD